MDFAPIANKAANGFSFVLSAMDNNYQIAIIIRRRQHNQDDDHFSSPSASRLIKPID
jgi:hypothetical protein